MSVPFTRRIKENDREKREGDTCMVPQGTKKIILPMSKNSDFTIGTRIINMIISLGLLVCQTNKHENMRVS